LASAGFPGARHRPVEQIKRSGIAGVPTTSGTVLELAVLAFPSKPFN
jgi:hypothetical protein